MIYTQAITQKDPHARRLAGPPYAGTLFAAYADNCAPVSGYTRHHYMHTRSDGGDDDDVGDGGAEDLMRLLGMLAPEVLFYVSFFFLRTEPLLLVRFV